jgi:hypothetical protein
MKTLQQQNASILRMLMNNTERRRLAIARQLPQPVRRRVALRRPRGMKLAVTFDMEELSEFAPAIRFVS